ncbi:hypothetical protein J6590_027305 [Homalodisca vitripennis]|nr:hypothetical protein J6590_027305 [Homalodisca vitripennis]
MPHHVFTMSFIHTKGTLVQVVQEVWYINRRMISTKDLAHITALHAYCRLYACNVGRELSKHNKFVFVCLCSVIP